MKKPEKIRKDAGDGHIFNTLQELKTYVYFHTSLKQKKIGYELDEDVITKNISSQSRKGG